MRIGIDARFLTHPQPGGFKTYSEHLLAALLALEPEHEYLLYVDRAVPAHLPQLPRHACWRVVSGQQPLVGMPWREQIGLAWHIRRDRLDLFHAPCMTAPLGLACPLVVTIHDMIWRNPARFNQGAPVSGKRRLMELYHRYIPVLAARRAAHIITVSHAAKADIVAELGLPAERVTVTHEAAKPLFWPRTSAEQQRVQQTYGLDSSYVLAIASADPRKNLATLLRAYARLHPRHQLAVVWTHRFLSEATAALVQELGITQQVRFLEGVHDADLAALYSGAALFVFPSRYEGFGLPLLEAMACGTAVVAANNSSIPEIVGDAALLFNADSPEQLAAMLHQGLENQALQAELRRHGLARAASFSWERCARETMAVYQQVVPATATMDEAGRTADSRV
ncbi:MAG: glycosyltransferase family 4 protein [Chloroflexaceae bacterium]|jgi:alpha-1,3-rhamnosyl/mannosyltransferase|nr:glycosyltransferase family 4 protein [Chloroflexaceae bacterium]